MTDVRTGDTVRVVLEGEADEWLSTNGDFQLGTNIIKECLPHVKSVEVIKRKLAVGDVLTGEETNGYPAMPLGTVVEGYGNTLVCVYGGWLDIRCPAQGPLQDGWFDPRTILYLPAK